MADRAPIGTVVLDLDGVVYLGSTPIPGAGKAISNLHRDGWQVIFATNNSTKTPHSIVAVLAERSHLEVEHDSVITSGMAAAAHLTDQGSTSAFVVGSSQLTDTIRGAGITITDHKAADAVVVGLDRSLTYDTIARAASAIRGGAVFVATNTDVTFPTADGLVPGAGTVVAAIEAASGTTPVACGKPHDPMTRLITRMLASENVWMVGDRPETDIALAKRAGWKSVLALTGVTGATDEIPSEFRPDHVIDSIRDLGTVVSGTDGIDTDEG